MIVTWDKVGSIRDPEMTERRVVPGHPTPYTFLSKQYTRATHPETDEANTPS